MGSKLTFNIKITRTPFKLTKSRCSVRLGLQVLGRELVQKWVLPRKGLQWKARNGAERNEDLQRKARPQSLGSAEALGMRPNKNF